MKRDIDFDATLVLAGMRGGFPAVCHAAMTLGMKGGPDAVLRHAEGLKKAGPAYLQKMAERVIELERSA